MLAPFYVPTLEVVFRTVVHQLSSAVEAANVVDVEFAVADVKYLCLAVEMEPAELCPLDKPAASLVCHVFLDLFYSVTVAVAIAVAKKPLAEVLLVQLVAEVEPVALLKLKKQRYTPSTAAGRQKRSGKDEHLP